MGVRILGDETLACWYDSTSMTAFGPVFHELADVPAVSVAEVVLVKIGDPRLMENEILSARVADALKWIEDTMKRIDDPDDLERMAKTGEERCRECSDWFLPDNIGALCEECRLEGAMLDAAERNGDAIREGA
jgi:hypothetical protein